MLNVSSHENGDTIYVAVVGQMDGSPCCKSLIETVKARLGEGHRKFVIELSGVTWMSSCGIGCLVSSYSSVRQVQGSPRVAWAKPTSIAPVGKRPSNMSSLPAHTPSRWNRIGIRCPKASYQVDA